jgi:hypothetical protein
MCPLLKIEKEIEKETLELRNVEGYEMLKMSGRGMYLSWNYVNLTNKFIFCQSFYIGDILYTLQCYFFLKQGAREQEFSLASYFL